MRLSSPESPTRCSCRWARPPDSSGKFHLTTQRHACPLKDRRAQLVKKASQSLPPLAANRVQSVFCRGVYLAENTSQTASVEFVPHRGTNYARSRLPEFVGKARRGFSTVSARLSLKRQACPLSLFSLLHPAGMYFSGAVPSGTCRIGSRLPGWWCFRRRSGHRRGWF